MIQEYGWEWWTNSDLGAYFKSTFRLSIVLTKVILVHDNFLLECFIRREFLTFIHNFQLLYTIATTIEFEEFETRTQIGT